MYKRITFGLVGLGLLASPLISSADTLSDLQAQIQALLGQISALKGQNTSLPPDDYGPSVGDKYPNHCPSLYSTIQRGSRNQGEVDIQVEELQMFLSGYYSIDPAEIVTKYFGSVTQSLVIRFQREQGLPAAGIVGALTRARIAQVCIGSVTYPNLGTITVTAPNGGEQWEIGQLNTITWAPYSYTPTEKNPARDVDVYLESCHPQQYGLLGCVTIGKVMDQGKASLHTYFNIDSYDKWADAGQYYVRVHNRVTGAEDRSDAPFTLLPRSVDLKVNGKDSGVVVTDNQQINVSWTGANYTYPNGCTLSGVRTSPNIAVTSVHVDATGSAYYYAYAPTPGAYAAVQLTCIDGAKGLEHTDYVSITSGNTQPASLRVMSPNGGEVVDPTRQMDITYDWSGISKYSAALYKNDQWKYWIIRDHQASAFSPSTLSWVPSASLSGLGEGDNAGAIWKIYITGVKSDGTGYVDDKSDASFRFSTYTAPAPKASLKVNGINQVTVNVGDQLNYVWSSVGGSTYSSTYTTDGPDCSGTQLGPNQWIAGSASGSSIVYTVPWCQAGRTYDATYVVTASDGQTAKASVQVKVNPTTLPPPLPTAQLTVNGTNSAIVNVGDTLSYEWFSLNGSTYSSTYTTDGPDCAGTQLGPNPWIANTQSGSIKNIVVPSCQAGRTYTATYVVTNAEGRSSSATVVVTVNPARQPVTSTSKANASSQVAAALTALESALQKIANLLQ